MCLENDGFFSTGLSQKERSKKKKKWKKSEWRTATGNRRGAFCLAVPTVSTSALRLPRPVISSRTVGQHNFFLSHKPNRRLFLQEKKNLIEICINSICGPWRQWKRFFFFLGCVSRNDRFLWDGCPSDWMFMFYLWKAFWWHQMNGMTQPLVAQRINKFWLQKSKGGRMKNTFAAILKRVKTYRHTRDTRVTHSGEPMMTCMCFTSFWLFLFSYFSIQ